MVCVEILFLYTQQLTFLMLFLALVFFVYWLVIIYLHLFLLRVGLVLQSSLHCNVILLNNDFKRTGAIRL